MNMKCNAGKNKTKKHLPYSKNRVKWINLCINRLILIGYILVWDTVQHDQTVQLYLNLVEIWILVYRTSSYNDLTESPAWLVTMAETQQWNNGCPTCGKARVSMVESYADRSEAKLIRTSASGCFFIASAMFLYTKGENTCQKKVRTGWKKKGILTCKETFKWFQLCIMLFTMKFSTMLSGTSHAWGLPNLYSFQLLEFHSLNREFEQLLNT